MDDDWPSRLAAATTAGGITAVYQPIIDTARGAVAGYEALTRFGHPVATNPEEWFHAAGLCGMASELEAACLTAAFASRATLPVNCFLTVNVGPDSLSHRSVRDVLDAQGDLTGVVIELTEHARIDSYLSLEPYLHRYRTAGALIAVDDAGSGYAGLQHLVHLRPAIIKVDRQFVVGIDRDETKRVLVEMLGTFADRTDAWLLAEGVERPEELDVLVRLGVPLVQGFLLGHPGPPWTPIDQRAARKLGSPASVDLSPTLVTLIETHPSAPTVERAVTLLSADAELDIVVIVDRNERVVGVADLESAVLGMTSEVMRIHPGTPVADAGRRAIARSRHTRFHPLVCTDDAGRYLGIVRIERLIEWLTAHEPANR